MTRQEFADWLETKPSLKKQVRSSAEAIPPNTIGLTGEMGDDLVVSLMFPIVSYVLKEIGLPWHYETRTFADLWRDKYRPWIDDQLEEQGMHPYAVESAGTELRHQLETLTDIDARRLWEELAGRLAS